MIIFYGPLIISNNYSGKILFEILHLLFCPTRGCRRLGQGSESECWNAFLEFLLKYQQQTGGGQAPEPPAVGQHWEIDIQNKDWRFVVRKQLIIPKTLQYFIISFVLWVIIDWGTAGGFRIAYFEKYGPTLLIYYIGYPMIFTILIFMLHWNEKRLFISTLIGIFIVEVIFTRNPLLITFPLLLFGIPLAIMIYLPLTYFPLWLIRKELLKHKILIIGLTIIELIVMFLTTFGNKSS